MSEGSGFMTYRQGRLPTVMWSPNIQAEADRQMHRSRTSCIDCGAYVETTCSPDSSEIVCAECWQYDPRRSAPGAA